MPFPIIDGHMHLATDSMVRKWTRSEQEESIIKKRREQFKIPRFELHSLQKTTELWKSEFNKYNIWKGVFLTHEPHNDEMLSFVKDTQFIGFTSVDPTEEDAPAMVEEDIRAGLKGLKLYPVNRGFSVSDKRCYPVYETAQALGIPVTIHFGVSIGYFSDLRYGNPIDLHPVARDFPDVTFILAHFGCGFLRESLFLSYQCQNIYFDTSSSNRWMEYLPYEITLKEVFQKCLKVLGPERLIYGTDSNFFPRGYRYSILQEQRLILDSLQISEEDQAKIFGENMARILNIRSG
ncbi:MAG: amidohydrolase [Theionarchaea archaeon]|nr:amidohydrolase [Theionarchaea archaeon]MBU7038034.1 amidohydrolase [Theionarchaea archaeon]